MIFFFLVFPITRGMKTLSAYQIPKRCKWNSKGQNNTHCTKFFLFWKEGKTNVLLGTHSQNSVTRFYGNERERGRERSEIKQSTHTHKIITSQKNVRRERQQQQHYTTFKKENGMEGGGSKNWIVHRFTGICELVHFLAKQKKKSMKTTKLN